MIRINGEIFYTCTELAKNMEHHDPEFVDLHHKFCDVYNRNYSDYMYDSYVQNKLYPAAEKKLIRFAIVQKKTLKVRCFTKEDVMKFLDLPEARTIQKAEIDETKVIISEVAL